ncbi:MAG: hypothetical protein COA79_25900 [Planctomycetota bacterium]|nr:MAG: hypothetical protein COA79_25900 [Planctomycetota bacterium]
MAKEQEYYWRIGHWQGVLLAKDIKDATQQALSIFIDNETVKTTFNGYVPEIFVGADGVLKIPPLRSVVSRKWDQPDRSEIKLAYSHAYMTQQSFDKLADYSVSIPSGVCQGKIWKKNIGAWSMHRKSSPLNDRDLAKIDSVPFWILCWYGRPSKTGTHLIESRIIKINPKPA